MAQYVVWKALTFRREDEKEINKFFQEQDWGYLRFKMKWNTLAGHGGTGGRTDVLFLYNGVGSQVGKFSVGRFRMGGISWLGDYVNNDRDIVPPKVLEKLRVLVKRTGDYKERADDFEEDGPITEDDQP